MICEKQDKSKKKAFIWTREFSCERLTKIQRIQRNYESIFKQAGDQGHYASFHWLGDIPGSFTTRDTFSAPVDGLECKIHLNVISTRDWFAKEIYTQALERTRLRYPGFDDHRFIDGLKIGERVLEFCSETWELARGHLWTSLWKIIEDDSPKVCEMLIIEPCTSFGYPLEFAEKKPYGNEIVSDHRLIIVVCNINDAGKFNSSNIRDILINGELPEIDQSPVSYSFEDIRGGFIELSSSELVVLNWADARKPLSDVDYEFHQSAEKLDRAGIENAIAKGANLNSLSKSDSSVINSIIESWGDHYWHCHVPENELDSYGTRPEREILQSEIVALIDYLIDMGAHPDLHGPEESPAIVTAAIGCYSLIMESLLKWGANSAINWAWDSYPGEWPQAWSSPEFDAFHEDDRDAKVVYDLLLLNRSSPCFTKASEESDIAEAHKNIDSDEWRKLC